MITRKIDPTDTLAGFTVRWIAALAERVQRLDVICQERRTWVAPSNVRIFSLGKEAGAGKFRQLLGFMRFGWQLTREADGVFCHQNPIYTILAAPWAKMRRRRLVSWYTHKSVDFKLRLMHRLADVVLTASPESFRLPSQKTRVVGHGIDTEEFRPAADILSERASGRRFRMIAVGRLSPVKRYELPIAALAVMAPEEREGVTLTIIGDPGLAGQGSYREKLRRLARDRGVEVAVQFLGGVAHDRIVRSYQEADVLVHSSETGSMDKVVLEAMACGLPVVSSSEAFRQMLSPWTHLLTFEKDNAYELADRLEQLRRMAPEERRELGQALREIVVKEHNLSALADRIISAFNHA
ncbi:glycosyltransferase family 4 protein [Candidatus Parcubacteria bacterium]|nr:glycosyltransferase family 4 protein [Candidatus Parcubacteria bacterium]